MRMNHKLKSLFQIPIFVSFIIIGITVALNLNRMVTIIAVIAMFAVQHFFRSPYWTLEKKYITNFTDDYIRVKIL